MITGEDEWLTVLPEHDQEYVIRALRHFQSNVDLVD